jgi:type II secretory pathway component PulC
MAVIALLVYAGVVLWYGRVEERLQTQQPAETQEKAAAQVQVNEESEPVANDYQVIVARNIFQAGLESGGPAGDSGQTDPDDLAETRLFLTLLGTVTGSKDDARAIIRDDKTKLEDLYQVGSQIQGAVINRITRGKVVLQVSGREEVLTIKDPESPDRGRPGSVRSEAALQGRTRVVQPQQVENKVPETMPRRRISFRNSMAPQPAAEMPVKAAPEPEELGEPNISAGGEPAQAEVEQDIVVEEPQQEQ